ncbi:MAG: ThuA domain-containing protein, partial [Armatimonadetes bacterium]|nr:ThuA domain-containing protein [Armatimonadota bacterium]
MKPPSCGRLLLPLLACASLAAAAPNLPMRVLLFTLSAGFKHGSVPVAEEVMTELGRSTRLFDTVVSQDVNDLSAANLAGYQAVFFYTTGNHPMTPELRAGLLDYVKNGGGFIGVHSATDTNYHWPEYADLIGAWFDGHPWTQTVRLKVEDREHPVTEHLDATLEIRDEIYQQRNWSRDKVQVLLSLDNASVNLQAPGVKRADQDFALAWCKEYGQGRVVYNGLGHFDEVWRDRRMQKMMLGAVKWVTRLDWRS